VDAHRAGGLTREALRERLRGRALRVTHPRLALLEALAAHPHSRADELAEICAARGAALPRATLFNTLNVLSRAQIIEVSATGPGRPRYEIRVEPHHHLVCRVCGRVCDVQLDQAPNVPSDWRAPEGWQLEETAVTLRGLCPDCRD